MNTIIKFINDKVDSIFIDTIEKINVLPATETDTSNIESSLLESHPLLLKIGVLIFVLVFGWFLKLLFDKYISIRPRLFLSLGNPLYDQRILGYNVGHKLTWIYESTLKNNSKYAAYNVKIVEFKKSGTKDKIISNKKELERTFTANNHLSEYDSLNFEIKKTIDTPPETLLQFEEVNGEKILIPGIKVKNPQIHLLPEELNNIRLVVIYENEKGKKFYTVFTRKSGIEKNKIKTLKPLKLQQLKQ